MRLKLLIYVSMQQLLTFIVHADVCELQLPYSTECILYVPDVDFSSGRPLNTPSSAGAPPSFDGGSGALSSSIALGSITANILTGSTPSDST